MTDDERQREEKIKTRGDKNAGKSATKKRQQQKKQKQSSYK